MTATCMTGCLCFFSFDFDTLEYQLLYERLLDTGAGVTEEVLFRFAFYIMAELSDIYKFMEYLDKHVFPEHVPNDAVEESLKVCVDFVIYITQCLMKYKCDVSLVLSNIDEIRLVRKTQTIELLINVWQ